MPEMSRATRLSEKIAEDLHRRRENARENPELPFGMQTVRADVFRKRFQRMTPDQRREVIKQMGNDGVLKALKGRD